MTGRYLYLLIIFMSFEYHSYVTSVLFVCHSYVLVCHLYLYSYVIRTSLVFHLYVTRIYSYVSRVLLLCVFFFFCYSRKNISKKNAPRKFLAGKILIFILWKFSSVGKIIFSSNLFFLIINNNLFTLHFYIIFFLCVYC